MDFCQPNVDRKWLVAILSTAEKFSYKGLMTTPVEVSLCIGRQGVCHILQVYT